MNKVSLRDCHAANSAARNDTALGFCFAAKGEKMLRISVFLFNETVETYRLVIASQCAHWRGNLKMQGCTLDNPKDTFRPENNDYLLF